MLNIEDANQKGKEAMDAMMKNYAEVTKGFQAIAAEATEFSKKSFQDMTSHMEKLTAAKSIEAVVELQTSFAKTSYESFVAEATKMQEMYADLAKTVYKPFETPMMKAAAPAATAA